MKTILVDAWNTFVTEDGINLPMQQLLDNFPNPKIIVTNASEEEKIKFGMTNLPYPLFSLAHNPNKTDPQYFKSLFEKFSLTAEQVVYFEHHPDAVASAKSIGIITYRYDKETENLKDLKLFLQKSL